MIYKRVFLIVLDSLGIGALVDASEFGDEGSNTLASVSESSFFYTPNLSALGLFNIDGVNCGTPAHEPYASYARMCEQSAGKDTTIGHWEIAGHISSQPFPVYPKGFPKRITDKFTSAVGRGILCNRPMSGTDAIAEYGDEHVATGNLIIYTSADSVFQIAAHEDVVPIEELYEICGKAREILCGKDAVARVIARPFTGSSGNYVRTANRRDFSVVPPCKTMLDYISEGGLDCISVGKISDIFAGRGITESFPTHGNQEGMEITIRLARRDFPGLVFTNLVDFDMLYGHRNDIDGYARALAQTDTLLYRLIDEMTLEDVLIITGDHGCDPGYNGTDHTREYTPMLIIGDRIRRGVNLGTRRSFADIGATIMDYLGVKGEIDGESFLSEVSAD